MNKNFKTGKTLSLLKLQWPSLTEMTRLAAHLYFAVFTVKWFYKLKLSVENKRCEKCDQIFDNREKHRCGSQSFISTDIKFQYLSQFKYE